MTSTMRLIPDAKQRSGTENTLDSLHLLGPGSALRSGRDDNWEIAR